MSLEKVMNEYFHRATKDLVGYPECPPYEEIRVTKGSTLKLIYFDLGHMQFEIIDIENEKGKQVCLNRIRVCNNVLDPKYYDNYFAPVDGLERIETE